MKILIVNASDINGGAARAAYRLHTALLSQNIDSQMLVQSKISDDFTVIGPRKKVEKILSKIYPILNNLSLKFYKNKTKTPFCSNNLPFLNIVDKINKINPDIVHLHWISGSMIRIEDLSKIKAPIIWSLHDMWAFTGGCHYDEECEGYKNTCGDCKVLNSNKENDLSRKVFNRKQRSFNKKKDITIVGLSHWINESSKNSTLLKNKKHVNLPNPIDTNIFKALDKQKARELWNLPQDKRLILFGAMGATSDPRKGFKELSESLKKIKNKNIEFVIFGSNKPENAPDLEFKTHYLGSLHDDISLVTLYSAVDVMIVPSLQENLSNAIMESLSCATPVVAFNIGGNADMIEHLKVGYLANAFDSDDLAYGIEWVIDNPNYDELCQNARKKIMIEFDNIVVAKKYIDLYNKSIK